VIALAVVATLVGGAVTLFTWLERDYAGRVDVVVGAPLPAPQAASAPEGMLTAEEAAVLTPEEIAAELQRRTTAERGLDTTRSFDVVAEVNPDHSVTITENIVQEFRTYRHGIERSIPLQTNLGTNLMRSLEVSTSPGTPGDVSVMNIADGVLVRIGDPDTTITGAHAYRLRYVLENVVTQVGGRSMVRLDAISDWDQQIDSLTYVIHGAGSPAGVACYIGVFRNTEGCGTAQQTADGGTFAAGRPLASGEGLTAEVTYALGTFAASPVRSSVHGPMGVAIGVWVALYVALAAAFVITVLRARRSRAAAASAVASTFEGPISESLPERMTRGVPSNDVLITDVYAEAPLEFVPPLGLDPASMLRLRDASTADVSKVLAATVVDLAADGMIILERRNADTWIIRRHDRQPRPVRPYEVVLLQALLGTDQERELGAATSSVSGALGEFMTLLDHHLHGLRLTAKEKMAFSAAKNPTGCVGAGMAGFMALVFGGVGFAVVRSAFGAGTSAVLLGLGLAAVALLAALLRDSGRPRLYTKRGLGTLFRIGGFERFFRDSEAIHARAASNYNVYREYMGYAVALDHLDDWIGAMPTDVAQSMVGGVPMAALAQVAYHPLWLASTRHYAAAHAPKGRSFSGGGGFSGGGFSGGGSGGGGGGSW